MAVMMKLQHVDELSGGRKRFRRRYPKVVAQVLGEEFFQVAMKARDGAALVSEREALLAEYKKLVSKARRKAAGQGTLSPLDHWRDAVREAEALVAGVVGAFDEDERRNLVAEDLIRSKANPLVYKAVVAPGTAAPRATLLDAKEMYRKERMNGATGRNQLNRLKRVCRRVEGALGPLHKLALIDLKREHGRTLRDFMLTQRKSDGSPLAPLTVRRELDMVRAIVSLGLTEFDLKGRVGNPFEGLDIAQPNEAPESEWERRDPLPQEVLLAMRERMRGPLRQPALGLIWRLLEGTGCRGAEIVGLRVQDVTVDGQFPHVWVRWHEDRRVKTKTSLRAVPLVGDALVAAREALRLAETSPQRCRGRALAVPMVFPRYAHPGGPDAVSQALMKHLRTVTDNPRHVVYSLRHNMKDLLVSAGVPERDEHRILGHALGGVGDRVYGGEEARLKAATEAIKKAIALAA